GTPAQERGQEGARRRGRRGLQRELVVVEVEDEDAAAGTGGARHRRDRVGRAGQPLQHAGGGDDVERVAERQLVNVVQLEDEARHGAVLALRGGGQGLA